MSDDSINRLFPDHNEESLSQPQEPPEGGTEQTPQETGGQEILSDIRSELAENQPPVRPPKKPGIFSRLFGRKSEPEKPRPAAPPAVDTNLDDKAERTAPIYDGASNEPLTSGESELSEDRRSSDAFEMYEGYEAAEYQAPEEPHLGGGTATGATPMLDLNELEIPAEPAGELPFLPEEAGPEEDSRPGAIPTLPIEGDEASPEWKSFLDRFRKPKDEDEEANRYRMADSQVENRLEGSVSLDGPEEAWVRRQREKKNKPDVYETIEGEMPKVDEDWLSELRTSEQPATDTQTESTPAFDVNIEEDWLNDNGTLESTEIAPTDRVELPEQTETGLPSEPAVASLEDDWMADLRGPEHNRDVGKTLPLTPSGDWFEDLSEEDHQALENRLESTTAQPEETPAVSPFDEEIIFEEPEKPAAPRTHPFNEPFELDDETQPDPAYLRTGSPFPRETPVLGENLELPSEGANPETAEEGQITGPLFSERYSSIFEEAEQEARPEEVAEMRTEFLEGYEAPETPAEALQAAPPASRSERSVEWFMSRKLAVQILVALAAVVLLLVAVFGAYYLVRTGAFAPKAAAVEQPTPTLPKNIPYPTGIRLTGGWYFVVSPGSVKSGGVWEPTTAEWLMGTEVRRVIGLPWNRQTEAVFKSLQPNDEIEVQLINGDKVVYVVQSVQQVPVGDRSIFSGQTQSLALILFEENAQDRWVAIAELKQEP